MANGDAIPPSDDEQGIEVIVAHHKGEPEPEPNPPTGFMRALSDIITGNNSSNNKLTSQNIGLLQEQELEAAERDGCELLRKVFDSMATNGKITMDQLPFVLVGADVQASAKEIDDAIEEQLPDADDVEALLEFHQVMTLYQQLMHNSAEVVCPADQLERQQVKPPIWKRAWRYWQLRRQQQRLKQTAYEKHMKPTTRLLLLILCTSCVISTAVVLFALIFIWNNSNSNMEGHLLRDVGLMKDGLYLFGYNHSMADYDFNMERLSSLLGTVVEELGYQGTKQTLTANLEYQEMLLGTLLDGWFEHDAASTALTTCTLTQSWLSQALAQEGEATALDLARTINPTLPAGHEVLIGKWRDATNASVVFAIPPQFGADCRGPCDPNAGYPMLHQALLGQVGTAACTDYRGRDVFAAYMPLQAGSGIGLAYKIDLDVLRAEFLGPVTAVVDEINAESTSLSADLGNQEMQTLEVVLGNAVNGQTQVLSAVRDCNATCLNASGLQASVLTDALNAASGSNDTIDFDGRPVVAAYGPMPSAGLGLVIKVAEQEVLDNLFVSLGRALDLINTKLEDTEEVQLATLRTSSAVGVSNPTNATSGFANASDPTNSSLTFYTAFKFLDNCTTGCGSQPNTSTFLRAAIANCSEGVAHALDYRGEMVTAGYACVPSLRAALALKVDRRQVLTEGTAMAVSIASYQNDVRFANSTTEIVLAQRKPDVQEVKTKDDYTRLTKLKFVGDCPNRTCTGPAAPLYRALNLEDGVMKGPDYRNAVVVSGYAYIPSLDLGVVLKVDAKEAEAPSIILTLELCACTVSAVIISMIVLAIVSNVLLKSMDRAWDEGKKAIEREKQQFSNVIQAMYPAQVAKRLLAGETQIVYNVANATVFFSDIYEFTATSNSVTPEELIQFMGYTFGVMDTVADHFHIHKVKTIGDAYLAVAGLPGSDPLSGSHTYDMMLFASCCCQLFSKRYIHPEDGEILKTVAKNLFGKKKTVKMAESAEASKLPRRPSGITYGNPGAAESAPADGPPPAYCVMRYGVAAGPITAGVLQGKTPLFDIWGKTVNLASRMESTGQPGRVQVSEGVYQAIVARRDQPFTFDARHKVFCKGFGNVSAYFVNMCTEAPPDALLERLHVEPNVGQFYFDNPVVGYRGSKGVHSESAHESAHESADRHSEHSSTASGRHGRTDSALQA